MRYSYEKRAMAYLIDIIASLIIAAIVVIISPVSDYYAFLENVSRALFWYSVIFFIYAFVSYFFFNGLSFGRKIFKTALRNKDLTKMSFKTCAMRALLQAFLPLTVINVFYQLFYRSTESLFDKITDTTSIDL